jgi:energy-converting hydrogenase Eha subunit G
MEGIPIGEARGSVKEAQTILLLLGTKRFGPPTEETQAAIEAIASVGWSLWRNGCWMSTVGRSCWQNRKVTRLVPIVHPV